MRKLTIGMVVVAIIAAAVVSLVPALCANGDTCDLTAVLRGSVRLSSAEMCRQTPAAAGCQVASVAGLKK